MSNEQTISTEPGKPAILFIWASATDHAREVLQRQRECLQYAHANGLMVVNVDSMSSVQPESDLLASLRLINLVYSNSVKIILFDGFPLSEGLTPRLFHFLSELIRHGCQIHCCKRGAITANELEELPVQDSSNLRHKTNHHRESSSDQFDEPARCVPRAPCAPINDDDLDGDDLDGDDDLDDDGADPIRSLTRSSAPRFLGKVYSKPLPPPPCASPLPYSYRPSHPGARPSPSGAQPPPGPPLRTHQDALPHDGLFIRRNNAFGTKSSGGIKELIEQGVLIDQAQIRFDDFIASDASDIPVPAAGEAIALSHGSAAVAGRYKAHAATTHFLEIALRAAPAPAGVVNDPKTLPVNFVFVVDTSSSMSGEKLDTVKTAIAELYKQLRDTDILGIVTFETQVQTVLKATPKSQLAPERFAHLVSALHAYGGTDINLGILYGIDEISRYGAGSSALVNCIYLFSDGDPTSGETSWIKLRANVAAKARGELKISCFGFGSNARTRELDALAGLTGGHSTFVVRPEDVSLNLQADLARREHLAAINLQLRIDIPAAITIWHLYGHDLITDPAMRAAVTEEAHAARRRARSEVGAESLPDLITQDHGIRIFAPDLAYGETYWIVFELAVPPGLAVPDFGRATVQYVDCVARASRQHELVLTTAGRIRESTALVHAVGLWTSETTFYALDDLYQQDRETAKTRLSNQIQALKAAHVQVPSPQFIDDQVTLRKLISLAENLGKTLSWSEDPGHGPLGYVTSSLSSFGQVRGGFLKMRAGTI